MGLAPGSHASRLVHNYDAIRSLAQNEYLISMIAVEKQEEEEES